MPVMVFMGIPGPVANGTNRIAILAQNLTAIATFARRGFRDFKLSHTLALCAIPGAIAGAMLGVQLEGVWFNRALALIMVAVMLIMYFDKGQTRPSRMHTSPRRSNSCGGHLLMIGVGFWGGFIQLGIGFIIMPVLNRVMGLDLVRTNMHKVFIVAVYTVIALLVFASQVELLLDGRHLPRRGGTLSAATWGHTTPLPAVSASSSGVLNVVLVLVHHQITFRHLKMAAARPCLITERPARAKAITA